MSVTIEVKFVCVYTAMHPVVVLYVNDEKIHQFKTNDPEIKQNSLILGNISKDFTIDGVKNN